MFVPLLRFHFPDKTIQQEDDKTIQQEDDDVISDKAIQQEDDDTISVVTTANTPVQAMWIK